MAQKLKLFFGIAKIFGFCCRDAPRSLHSLAMKNLKTSESKEMFRLRLNMTNGIFGGAVSTAHKQELRVNECD